MSPIKDYIANPSAIDADALFCSIDPSSRGLLRESAAEIARRPDLLADLEAIDKAIDKDNATWNAAPWRRGHRDPSPGEAFLLAFPVLHHVASIRAFYQERKIPDRYLKAVLSDLQRWIVTHCQRTQGLPGFSEISWLREHVSGRIFELGRLQFQPGRWSSMPTLPLRNRVTGETVFLAKSEGDSVTTEGGYASAAGARQEGAVPLRYEVSGDGITAHRILADGTVSRTAERFETRIWEAPVAEGDPVINIHIPCGSPLAPSACRDSIREALRFFPTYFPDWPIARAKVFVCASWLLYPDFRKILRPGSNILAFQDLFHLFPIPSMEDHQFYERAFVPWGRKVTRGQLTTSLQFALFDYIAAGHTPVEGGGVILADDYADRASSEGR